MTENVPSEGLSLTQPTETSLETARAGMTPEGNTLHTGPSRGNRTPNRFGIQQSTANRDFAGATPKIGGVLGLRSENVTKKVNYDSFCKKIRDLCNN